eukprot:461315-Hanusia_phi.AAC.1
MWPGTVTARPGSERPATGLPQCGGLGPARDRTVTEPGRSASVSSCRPARRAESAAGSSGIRRDGATVPDGGADSELARRAATQPELTPRRLPSHRLRLRLPGPCQVLVKFASSEKRFPARPRTESRGRPSPTESQLRLAQSPHVNDEILLVLLMDRLSANK